jgi:hypothetical protein
MPGAAQLCNSNWLPELRATSWRPGSRFAGVLHVANFRHSSVSGYPRHHSRPTKTAQDYTPQTPTSAPADRACAGRVADGLVLHGQADQRTLTINGSRPNYARCMFISTRYRRRSGWMSNQQLQWQGHPNHCQHRLSVCESFVRSRMLVVPYELCRNMPKIKPQHMHDYPTQTHGN